MFTDTGGENLQRHRFTLAQNDVLSLSGPCEVEVELRMEDGRPAAEAAGHLADPESVRWSFRGAGGEIPLHRCPGGGERAWCSPMTGQRPSCRTRRGGLPLPVPAARAADS